MIRDEDAERIVEGLVQDGAVAAADDRVVPGALVDELLRGLIGIGDVEVDPTAEPLGIGSMLLRSPSTSRPWKWTPHQAS